MKSEEKTNVLYMLETTSSMPKTLHSMIILIREYYFWKPWFSAILRISLIKVRWVYKQNRRTQQGQTNADTDHYILQIMIRYTL